MKKEFMRKNSSKIILASLVVLGSLAVQTSPVHAWGDSSDSGGWGGSSDSGGWGGSSDSGGWSSSSDSGGWSSSSDSGGWSSSSDSSGWGDSGGWTDASSSDSWSSISETASGTSSGNNLNTSVDTSGWSSIANSPADSSSVDTPDASDYVASSNTSDTTPSASDYVSATPQASDYVASTDTASPTPAPSASDYVSTAPQASDYVAVTPKVDDYVAEPPKAEDYVAVMPQADDYVSISKGAESSVTDGLTEAQIKNVEALSEAIAPNLASITDPESLKTADMYAANKDKTKEKDIVEDALDKTKEAASQREEHIDAELDKLKSKYDQNAENNILDKSVRYVGTFINAAAGFGGNVLGEETEEIADQVKEVYTSPAGQSVKSATLDVMQSYGNAMRTKYNLASISDTEMAAIQKSNDEIRERNEQRATEIGQYLSKIHEAAKANDAKYISKEMMKAYSLGKSVKGTTDKLKNTIKSDKDKKDSSKEKDDAKTKSKNNKSKSKSTSKSKSKSKAKSTSNRKTKSNAKSKK